MQSSIGSGLFRKWHNKTLKNVNSIHVFPLEGTLLFYLIIIYSSKAWKCLYVAVCLNLWSFLCMMKNFRIESFKGHPKIYVLGITF